MTSFGEEFQERLADVGSGNILLIRFSHLASRFGHFKYLDLADYTVRTGPVTMETGVDIMCWMKRYKARSEMTLDEQAELLLQGTEYGNEKLASAMGKGLRERLDEGRPLRVYCGYDPTSTDLHLGHTITMRKLRQFQDFGHEVTFLIGSYTALVGDPSDKNKARPILTEDQVYKNASSFSQQAFRILDANKTSVQHNDEWLSKLSLLDLIRLGQNFTVQQFLARENFSKRLDRGEPIYLHETFYALMQGYDAAQLDADVQVGGTDQLFNIVVAGRKLQEALGKKPQIAVIMGILPGTDGVQRMSKTTGNHIPIKGSAFDMYGKVMSVPDRAMYSYMRLSTRWTPSKIEGIAQRISDGNMHPRDAKMELAHEITGIFHGEQAAVEAEDNFRKVFQKHGVPDEMPVYQVEASTLLVDFLAIQGLVSSKGEARRLIKQGGIRLGGKKVVRTDIVLDLRTETVLQVGKRKFASLLPGD